MSYRECNACGQSTLAGNLFGSGLSAIVTRSIADMWLFADNVVLDLFLISCNVPVLSG